MSREEEKRRKFMGRHINIIRADIGHRTTTAESEDSKLRREIHLYIKSLRGKNKEEALQDLYEKFKDEKYKKYYQYFETWVDCEVIGIDR